MENLNEALELLVVGMLTVFAILLIVIYFGKALIALVNRFAPAEVVAKKHQAASAAQPGVDAKTRGVLDAVVKELTGGKGRVKSVSKV